MTEQFLVKNLLHVRLKPSQVYLNLIFQYMEITVDGSRKTSKGKNVAAWFPESFFAEGKLQNNVSFSRKMFCVACTLSLGINTSQ